MHVTRMMESSPSPEIARQVIAYKGAAKPSDREATRAHALLLPWKHSKQVKKMHTQLQRLPHLLGQTRKWLPYAIMPAEFACPYGLLAAKQTQ